MKLIADYNWRNGPAARELMERVLTDKAYELIREAVDAPIDETVTDKKTIDDLLYIRALRRESGRLHLNVPVILQADSAKMTQAGEVFADSLSEEIARSVDPACLDTHPRVKTRDDRMQMIHFLTGPVTLGWQGHEMLTRLEKIPSRAENTDDKGRWYLLRFFEPVADEYPAKKTGAGGSFWGDTWSLSTSALSIETNILSHFADILGSVAEDEYEIRNSVIKALIDGLGNFAESRGKDYSSYAELAERLGLTHRGNIVAPVLTTDEFEAPKLFVRNIYDTMVRWWNENESNIDEVLDDLTPGRNGIAHRNMYHWAWRNISGGTGEKLLDRGFMIDLNTLENGAINVFWQRGLHLQSNVFA